jgi:hypothetical protein
VSKSFSHVDVPDCELVIRTPKAVLIDQDGVEVWIPRSQIQPGSESLLHPKDTGRLVLPEWLAIDKELIHYQRVDTTRWSRPKTSYGASRRQLVLEQFDGVEEWEAVGVEIRLGGEVLGIFGEPEHARIAANAARVVCDVIRELDRVHRWASMMTSTEEELEDPAIESG